MGYFLACFQAEGKDCLSIENAMYNLNQHNSHFCITNGIEQYAC